MVTSFLFSTDTVKLSQENKTALDNYKYQGGDNGISYIYIHSPIAQFIASLLPMNLAPNLVTLAGNSLIVLTHIMTYAWYGGAFSGPVDDWAPLLIGVLHMAYITLDNVDGKQARRTGTSSPLGQLFDHGCDALTFSFMVLTMSRYFQLGTGWLTYVFITMSPSGYFVFNFKEYYLGEYVLPSFNSISEGSIIGFIFMVYTSYLGWEKVASPVFYGFSSYEIFASFIITLQTLQNIQMIFEILQLDTKIMRALGFKNVKDAEYEIPFKSKSFLMQFSSYLLLLIL